MSPAPREQTGPEPRTSHAPREEEPQSTRPRPYLRTVYPLNPGIPHFLDFPRGWK